MRDVIFNPWPYWMLVVIFNPNLLRNTNLWVQLEPTLSQAAICSKQTTLIAWLSCPCCIMACNRPICRPNITLLSDELSQNSIHGGVITSRVDSGTSTLNPAYMYMDPLRGTFHHTLNPIATYTFLTQFSLSNTQKGGLKQNQFI